MANQNWTLFLVVSGIFCFYGVVTSPILLNAGPLDTVRCIWRSSISSTIPLAQEARPRQQCSLGQLDWYYPRGNLSSLFRHSQDAFAVCVSLQASIDSICPRGSFRLLNGIPGRETEVRTPGRDSVVCFDAEDGRVNLLVEASSNMPKCRLISITYFRNPP
ncbi:hypothetical protein CAPTEDRAFT_222160 [Capitella teleta]|uniref:Uncharacterized protein n=1 Tax=Capitella teleta TaxID=283909 RepID=X2ASX3_CAPTE|nr:hypothetical protein CAPTEDRAFT_222160 [Capitella teleta]|eukprot:ELT88407.1 hypothetical protein CAPTEDRAFT_222160 [Capitella teleta]